MASTHPHHPHASEGSGRDEAAFEILRAGASLCCEARAAFLGGAIRFAARRFEDAERRLAQWEWAFPSKQGCRKPTALLQLRQAERDAARPGDGTLAATALGKLIASAAPERRQKRDRSASL